jgi:nucleolar pre-ribosomal-associated protein 1
VLTITFQSLDFSEKAQTLYTINMLCRLHKTASNQTPRLPTYTTLFFAHALRAIYDPTTFIYPMISRFLLQRPEFDQHDVPMFYATLFSAGDEWKKDRAWILRYLANGMLSTADWRVLKRRHVWDLLATMYQSSRDDKALCTSILKVALAGVSSR